MYNYFKALNTDIVFNVLYIYILFYIMYYIHIAVFEIALVRLSETSDYLHGQVNNPSAVIRGTSENLQPDCTVLTSDQTPLKLIQIWARRMTQSTA